MNDESNALRVDELGEFLRDMVGNRNMPDGWTIAEGEDLLEHHRKNTAQIESLTRDLQKCRNAGAEYTKRTDPLLDDMERLSDDNATLRAELDAAKDAIKYVESICIHPLERGTILLIKDRMADTARSRGEIGEKIG